jgi:hypothetical protein
LYQVFSFPLLFQFSLLGMQPVAVVVTTAAVVPAAVLVVARPPVQAIFPLICLCLCLSLFVLKFSTPAVVARLKKQKN